MLTLVRDIRTNDAILGRLYHNGGIVCYTLENASKAIPCGLYTVQNSKSPKFKRELPMVYNSTTVKAIRGIRIHRADCINIHNLQEQYPYRIVRAKWSGKSGSQYSITLKDSQGCILVGMGRSTEDFSVTESRPAETMVTMLCRNEKNLVIVDY